MVPVLVPRSRASEIRGLIDETGQVRRVTPVATAFDELFVDLGDEDEES
jgi:hypothetical protein